MHWRAPCRRVQGQASTSRGSPTTATRLYWFGTTCRAPAEPRPVRTPSPLPVDAGHSSYCFGCEKSRLKAPKRRPSPARSQQPPSPACPPSSTASRSSSTASPAASRTSRRRSAGTTRTTTRRPPQGTTGTPGGDGGDGDGRKLLLVRRYHDAEPNKGSGVSVVDITYPNAPNTAASCSSSRRATNPSTSSDSATSCGACPKGQASAPSSPSTTPPYPDDVRPRSPRPHRPDRMRGPRSSCGSSSARAGWARCSSAFTCGSSATSR